MYNGPEFRESVMAECLKEVREGVTEMGWRRHEAACTVSGWSWCRAESDCEASRKALKGLEWRGT